MSVIRQVSYVCLFCLLTVSFEAWALSDKKKFDWLMIRQGSVTKRYLKIHKKFTKQMCRPGIEEHYKSLERAYRTKGHFLPLNHNDKVDLNIVKKHIYNLKDKKKWIKKQIKYVEGKKSFGRGVALISELEHLKEKLLYFKRQHYYGSASDKKKISKESRSLYKHLGAKFSELTKEIPFLLNYGFPVDHFKLRKEYDKYKDENSRVAKKRANKIYLRRRLVQDGAQSPSGGSRDRFLRASIDTVFLKLKNKDAIISENLRYDIKYVLRGVKRQLARGKATQLKRLEVWAERIDKEIAFNRSILENKITISGGVGNRVDIINRRAKARYNLRKFVLDKKVDVYNFWKKQDELMRILYVMETILVNEASDLDGRDALERRDIARVVHNRRYLSEYSSIESWEEMYEALGGNRRAEAIADYPWLNVLFKEREFSFTLFFIGGNLRIYCPEMTKRGRFLRKENLSIALDTLSLPESAFNAVRYFSRASMLGRIDMSPLWGDFTPLPERPGRRLGQAFRLARAYRRGNYKHLYHFVAADGKTYQVVDIKGEMYAYSPAAKVFFTYRNPHYFRYFAPPSG